MAGYSDPTYKRNRASILAGNPLCHWCGKATASQADHLIELDAGGDHSLDNLVPSCARCNASRGTRYLNSKTAKRIQARNEALNASGSALTFLDDEPMTPTPHSQKTPTGADTGYLGANEAHLELSGRIEPRLVTARPTDLSLGPAMAEWVKRHMDIELMPWQRTALDGQLAVNDKGDFVFRESLVSTARQQGKSVALRALAGWFLASEAARRGKPVNVLLVANKLERSMPLFRELAIFLEDRYGAEVRWANGSQQVTMPDRSTFRVAAARDNVHGMTLDLILVDEIWDIAPSVIYDALRPSMIAVKNPLLSMWSTAGDQGSTLMLGLREQAISAIDSGKPGRLFFAEWSPPPGINPDDRRHWVWANPALGTTVSWDALEAAAEGGDRASFLRAHLNLWVAATKAWLPAGTWEKLTTDSIPAGGILAVDNSIDETRYVGVRAVADGTEIKIKLEFIVNSADLCWQKVAEIMAEPTVQLTVTPGLEALMPTQLQRRSSIVGYGELLKYTQIVRSLILEGRLKHDGSNALSEHVNRAVAVKTQNSIVLSSQKSPGPIELARCMVWAAAIAARPANRTKPAFAFG